MPVKHGRVKKYDHFGLGENISRKLVAVGVNTPRQIRAMTDEELDAIQGIGPGQIKKIREVFPHAGG